MLDIEQRAQIRTLVEQDHWDEDTIVFFMVIAQLVKLPIPAIALLWANAAGDFYEMYPVEDEDGDTEDTTAGEGQ